MVFGRRDADGALQAETENPLGQGGWQELDEGPELGNTQSLGEDFDLNAGGGGVRFQTFGGGQGFTFVNLGGGGFPMGGGGAGAGEGQQAGGAGVAEQIGMLTFGVHIIVCITQCLMQ